MTLNRLFDEIEKAREVAHWRAAFGEPEVLEGQTLIPVAQVGFGYGLGFGVGAGAAKEEEEEPRPAGEGGGGGGGAQTKPLGAIVVTAEGVHFEPVMDMSRIALAAIGLGALAVLQMAKTLRALFG